MDGVPVADKRGGGSMPLLRMRGAASSDDMNLTNVSAASRCFDTASMPTAESNGTLVQFRLAPVPGSPGLQHHIAVVKPSDEAEEKQGGNPQA